MNGALSAAAFSFVCPMRVSKRFCFVSLTLHGNKAHDYLLFLQHCAFFFVVLIILKFFPFLQACSLPRKFPPVPEVSYFFIVDFFFLP